MGEHLRGEPEEERDPGVGGGGGADKWGEGEREPLLLPAGVPVHPGRPGRDADGGELAVPAAAGELGGRVAAAPDRGLRVPADSLRAGVPPARSPDVAAERVPVLGDPLVLPRRLDPDPEAGGAGARLAHGREREGRHREQIWARD